MSAQSSAEDRLKKSSSLWESTLRKKNSSSWKVGEMRLYLQLKGEDDSGKKADLQKRVSALLLSGTVTGELEDDTAGASSSDVRFPDRGWKKLVDVTQEELKMKFSIFSLMDYFMCRKSSDGLDADDMRAVSSHSFGLYSKKYCRDGEVCLENGTVYFRGFCKAEMKTSMRYKIAMAMKREPSVRIIYASCECRAGIGPSASCKHIGAMCYGLEEFCRRGIFTGMTCSTSDLQAWSAPPGKRRVSDMEFAKPVFNHTPKSTSSRASFDPRAATAPKDSAPEERQRLFDLLSSCSQPANILDTLRPCSTSPAQTTTCSTGSTDCRSVPELVQLMKESRTYRSTFRPDGSVVVAWCDMFMRHMQVSRQQRHALEYRTRGQAGNRQWKMQRYGRLTASNFGVIVKCKSAHPSLVKRLLSQSVINSPALSWGREHEDEAVRIYLEKQHMSGMNGLCVSRRGLVVMQCGYVAASPDGIVFVPTQPLTSQMGLLEVKCPYSHRHHSPQDACMESGSNPFYCTWSDGGLCLRRQHDYFYQVQGGMAVAEVQWCDFVVWTPMGIAIQRIPFDAAFWKEQMEPKLTGFYRGWLLPQLLHPQEEPVCYTDVAPADLTQLNVPPPVSCALQDAATSPTQEKDSPPRQVCAAEDAAKSPTQGNVDRQQRMSTATGVSSCCQGCSFDRALALHPCKVCAHQFHHMCTNDDMGKVCSCCLRAHGDVSL
ncbi:uncharacterized protein LOC135813389 [Sycon ciliatum]|uniref:uncharacterized protein LOC135813389 n=1 Tax=Sycon ciliatum TaxID=27933 RepID=UPI0031F7221E